MKAVKAWALVAYYSDASGIPDVLYVSDNKDYINELSNTIALVNPIKVIGVVETKLYTAYLD